jgi:hypothetical protein
VNNETDRALAMRVLRDTLRDSDAKPSERVSAAKLLLEHDGAKGAGPGALHVLTAAELLALARGEGDTPPRMGPAESHAVAVPSQAHELPGETPTVPAKPNRYAPDAPVLGVNDGKAITPPADPFGRTPGAFLKRGPKKESPNSPTPGGIPPMGPKTDPSFSATPTPNSVDIDPLS